MKAFTVSAVVFTVLVAGVAAAQQPPVQQTPAKPLAAPAAQSAVKPAAAPAPEAKFPEGARFAFLNIQRIAAESAEGKASSTRLEQLRAKKATDLNDKNKQVESLQAKQKSSVMSDDARLQVQRDIDKLQVEIQRTTQDAQQELQDMQNELQLEFQRKIAPIIQQVATERSIQMLFSQGDSGLVWADAGLDLTAEVIRRFDTVAAASKAPVAPAPIKK
ncbi:MAG: OmpH family outer membrane protein [Acidobacteriota bacterium]